MMTNMSKFKYAKRRSYCIYRRGVQKQKIQRNTTAQGFSSIGAFMFVLVVGVGILYLFSTNEVAIKGDEIYTIEQEIKELTKENEQLVIQEAQLRSLESIEEVVKEQGMSEIVDPIYIERETRVALD